MATPFHIAAVTGLHPGLARLQDEAGREGFNFVGRLVDDWYCGANRFDGPGEVLIGAIQDGRLVGVGGLNRDPYQNDMNVGRLRHLYVIKAARKEGVGRALVRYLLAAAGHDFSLVRLRSTAAAAAFYERLGFHAVREQTASHVIMLR